MFQRTALDSWKEECGLDKIITMSKTLDHAMGNGVPANAITEFCGPPGSGKTQICLQLCVSVQIPSVIGGLDGSAVFIDTNHGFSTQRLNELARACVQHCQAIIRRSSSHNPPVLNLNESDILNNIFCTFISDYVELLATVQQLKEILRNNSKIRLIVIDSFSFLFRHDFESLDRVRILYRLLADLETLAVEHKCAVVITNELTTRLPTSDDDVALLVPALGDSHSHRVTQQIMLGREIDSPASDRYLARIRKSLYRPDATVSFRITKDGICDIPSAHI